MDNIFNFVSELESHYLRSIKRLILLDYDGTLEPHNCNNRDVAMISTEVRKLLKDLASDECNQVAIISGRKRDSLDWFGDLPIMLVAEHGGFHKNYGESWTRFFDENIEWKNKAYSALLALTIQFDGSFIEEKHYSLTWHYGRGLETIPLNEKKEIFTAINSLPYRNEFLLYDQDLAIEFRTIGINKGRFARHLIHQEGNDFVIAIGDGTTDEDLFEGAGKSNFTIKVGKDIGSSARFFLADQHEVLHLLSRFAVLSKRLQGKIR
ncbi:MAG TPA: trehalose-phosphatase [Cyclobacteriaceae bacterium]|nr:trehalose-phosphatase [Cyclobacteriaceae bacterium]